MKCIVIYADCLFIGSDNLKTPKEVTLPKVTQLVSGRFQHKLDNWKIHLDVTQISISQNVIFSSLKICSLSSIHSYGQDTLHVLVALYVTISSFPSFFLPFSFPPSLLPFLPSFLLYFLPFFPVENESVSHSVVSDSLQAHRL